MLEFKFLNWEKFKHDRSLLRTCTFQLRKRCLQTWPHWSNVGKLSQQRDTPLTYSGAGRSCCFSFFFLKGSYALGRSEGFLGVGTGVERPPQERDASSKTESDAPLHAPLRNGLRGPGLASLPPLRAVAAWGRRPTSLGPPPQNPQEPSPVSGAPAYLWAPTQASRKV